MNTAGGSAVPTIGLCMIVKNEAHIIRRCLDSVLPLIDYVVIIDTGSSDGTQEVVRAWLVERAIPGEVIDEPWRDFGYNRSFALKKLRERIDIDYSLMINADEVLEYSQDFDVAAFKRRLTEEVYNITAHYAGFQYTRAQLVSNRKPFRYIGVLHECIEGADIEDRPVARGLLNTPIQDGARNKNPQVFAEDVRVIEKALARETNPFLIARYTFYLAQSYRDLGDTANALVYYAKRAALGHSAQEIYVSLNFVGAFKQHFGLPAEEILEAYRQAIALCPERAEAYHDASFYLRQQNRFAEGYEIAKAGLGRTVPDNALFANLAIYRTALLDEYSVNAYWAGHFDESLQACRQILALPDIAPDLRQRVEKNAEFATAKLAEKTSKKIGLCMIVKNEAHVIRRCLDSVRPLIDYVLIVDTGSSDGTQDAVRSYLREANLPGQVVDEPWQDFAHNRSAALARLRERAEIDYALMIDADEVLVFEPGFDARAFKAGLDADLYDINCHLAGVIYHRPQLMSNRKPFYYKGVVHEYVECPDIQKRLTATGFHNAPVQDSARNKNPRKYQDDAAALEQALAGETDPFLISRYTFYLGQSYKDAGELDKALAAYLRRAELGFWNEEIYIALYSAAQVMEHLGRPTGEIVDAYLRATEICPARAEAMHGAIRYCRTHGRNQQSYALAKHALTLAMPESGLFVERWIYEYGLLDEFSIAAYWAGHYRDSIDAARRLLDENRIPADHHERLRRNIGFAIAKIDAETLQGMAAPSPSDSHEPNRSWLASTIKPRPAAAPLPTPPIRLASQSTPKILMTILAKQKEPVLPFYLDCLEALDYPKSAISLYVRTNNNTDRTGDILKGWLARVGSAYAGVEYDDRDVPDPIEKFAVHDWNAERLKIIRQVRQASLAKLAQTGSDFYFTADVDNFLRPHSLRTLVGLNLPIVAPFLRHVDANSRYSNWHDQIDANGYLAESGEYDLILYQKIRGLLDLPVVHCTYLVRGDVLPQLTYEDGSGRFDYVIFSHSARRAAIPQYLDNREIYGYLTLDESPVAARLLMGGEIDAALARR